jgi:hypothetical protein
MVPPPAQRPPPMTGPELLHVSGLSVTLPIVSNNWTVGARVPRIHTRYVRPVRDTADV